MFQPKDCLIYGAAEMYLSQEVAIIQHHTSVYQVSGDFFENGATYFAKMCYAQIRFNVSNGECSPFVGHNAFVRWKAIQDVAMDTGNPDYVMYWSEYHISEDFNMSIRLQSADWVTRYASYHQDEFKEQVSLTIYDEISRWERYSYGDSELIFNPFWSWLWRTPFTPLFRKFLFCDMHWSSKLSILSYMTSCKLGSINVLFNSNPCRLCHRQWLHLHHRQLRPRWSLLGQNGQILHRLLADISLRCPCLLDPQ